MGRFSNLISAETPYYKTDKNNITAISKGYDVFKDEQARTDLAKNAIENAKAKYGEWVTKFHPKDIKRASKLMDEFTTNNANSVIKNDGTPFLSSSLQEATSFLYNPQMQEMLSRGEYFNAQQEAANKLELEGKTSQIQNNDANQALFSDDGIRHELYTKKLNSNNQVIDVPIDWKDIRVSQVINTNEEMNNYFKEINPDVLNIPLSKEEHGYLKAGTLEMLSPAKLTQIANSLFGEYLKDGVGVKQLNDLTTHSTTNNNPVSVLTATEQMKKQFIAVANAKRYTKSDTNYVKDIIGQENRESARASQKLEEEKLINLPTLENATNISGSTEKGGWFNTNIGIPFRFSTDVSNIHYNQIPSGTVYTMDNDGEAGVPSKLSKPLKGVWERSGLGYVITKTIGSDGREINTDKKGHLVNKGEHLWLGTKAEVEGGEDNIPQVDNKTGQLYYTDKANNRIYVTAKPFKVIRLTGKDGKKDDNKFALEQITDVGTSILKLGGNHTDSKPFKLSDSGNTLDMNNSFTNVQLQQYMQYPNMKELIGQYMPEIIKAKKGLTLNQNDIEKLNYVNSQIEKIQSKEVLKNKPEYGKAKENADISRGYNSQINEPYKLSDKSESE